MADLDGFEGEEVVATIKMDGEQTNLYRDGFHARSLDTPKHPSRDWLWGLFRRVGHQIPEAWRICGENLFAKHSIHYRNLKAYFLMFSVWNEDSVALSWKETVEWSELLGIPLVPVVYLGPWNHQVIHDLYQSEYDGDECEGYVVRVTKAIPYQAFRRVVGKYVRKSHVQTDEHWMRKPVVQNELSHKGSER